MSKIPPEPEALKRARMDGIKDSTTSDLPKIVLLIYFLFAVIILGLLCFPPELEEKLPPLNYSIHCIDGTKYILFNIQLQPHYNSDGNLRSCE